MAGSAAQLDHGRAVGDEIGNDGETDVRVAPVEEAHDGVVGRGAAVDDAFGHGALFSLVDAGIRRAPEIPTNTQHNPTYSRAR